MKKLPISLIVDDPAPRVHVFWAHSSGGVSAKGTPLRPDVPNDFLDEFCDVTEKENVHGKFSIVPMAGCQGDIIHGFRDYPDAEIAYWLETANKRLGKRFSFGPEMLTHHKAVNLADGSFYDCNEMEWAATQNRQTLGVYIETAIRMLKDAGIRAVGVTSPWSFGVEVEDDYAAAISDAVWNVWGEPDAWYFLRSLRNVPDARPWVQFTEGNQHSVAIPATTNDVLWQSIDMPASEVNDAYISALADQILTEDGQHGTVADAMKIGAMPVLIHHWQSLFSNGSRAGLHAFAIAVERINRNFGDRVEWMNFEDIAHAYLRGEF